MDTATMVTRVYDGLRDAPREFIPPEEVLSWLNEAQDDLANRLKVLTKYEEGQVVGGVIALPDDLIEVRDLQLGGDFADLQFPGTDVAFNQTKYASPYGALLARITGNNIEVEAEDNTDYQLRYVYDPPDLTTEPNTTSELPRELHVRMVQYARSHGKLREGEDAHARAYMEMYERGLPPAPLGITRINPGPVSFGYEPGPFDTAEAKHR